MTTMNGFPRSCDSFIQGICFRNKLITFNKIWEECTQEEARRIQSEENMGETKYQALTIYSIRNHRKKEEDKRKTKGIQKRSFKY